MLHKKIKILALLGLGSIFILVGCYKDKTVPIVKTDVITTPVSFSQDLVPLFTKNCSMSGCHSTGGQAPDLTPNNAFKSLTQGSYVDVNDPKNSIIMLYLTGVKTPAMPLGAPTNPSNINALMLAWITQGAKNN